MTEKLDQMAIRVELLITKTKRVLDTVQFEDRGSRGDKIRRLFNGE